MHIPMIFFTIIIEKRKITAEEREALYLQEKAIAEIENHRNKIAAQLPEYCYRL